MAITPKRIDVSSLTSETIKKLTFEDLLYDAATRSVEAIHFLRDEHEKMVDWKGKQRRQRLDTYRVKYLENFCGYVKPVKQPTLSKFEKMIEEALSLVPYPGIKEEE